MKKAESFTDPTFVVNDIPIKLGLLQVWINWRYSKTLGSWEICALVAYYYYFEVSIRLIIDLPDWPVLYGA